MVGIYKIIDSSPVYQKSLEGLPIKIKETLDLKLKILEKCPFKIAKELRKPLKGKYSVRLDGYRLICSIDLNSHKVFLLSVHARSQAYLIGP